MHELKFTASDAESFLCHAIRHTDRIEPEVLTRAFDALGDAEAFAAATKNGVVPIVAHGLLTGCADGIDLAAHWRDAFETTEARIAAYMDELDRVAAALAQEGVPLIALKNSGITRGIYQHPGASPMGDVDVLVKPADFRQAHAVLQELGYTLKFRNEFESEDIDEAFAGGGAEYSRHLPTDEHLWFELQWRPIAGRWIQPDQEPKAEDLFARSRGIDGSNVRVLSPEDNLLQVCLHTAKHSFVRAPGFRLHTDVERVVTCEQLDWTLFLSKVGDLRVRTACYFSLAMAHSLLGTEVPEHVLSALSPPRWKVKVIAGWLDRVGVFNPNDRKWSNPGYMAFVALLYDSPRDLWKAVFPSLAVMQARYDGVTRWNAPWFHVRRISGLILRRTGI